MGRPAERERTPTPIEPTHTISVTVTERTKSNIRCRESSAFSGAKRDN
jgi:hypothetical protein